jgi:hypothetical protein
MELDTNMILRQVAQAVSNRPGYVRPDWTLELRRVEEQILAGV